MFTMSKMPSFGCARGAILTLSIKLELDTAIYLPRENHLPISIDAAALRLRLDASVVTMISIASMATNVASDPIVAGAGRPSDFQRFPPVSAMTASG